MYISPSLTRSRDTACRLLSSGVSRLSDIEEAVDRSVEGPHSSTRDIVPAPEEEYNLSLLPELSALLGLPVGVPITQSTP
jgi:sialic acid synthase SpsE